MPRARRHGGMRRRSPARRAAPRRWPGPRARRRAAAAARPRWQCRLPPVAPAAGPRSSYRRRCCRGPHPPRRRRPGHRYHRHSLHRLHCRCPRPGGQARRPRCDRPPSLTLRRPPRPATTRTCDAVHTPVSTTRDSTGCETGARRDLRGRTRAAPHAARGCGEGTAPWSRGRMSSQGSGSQRAAAARGGRAARAGPRRAAGPRRTPQAPCWARAPGRSPSW